MIDGRRDVNRPILVDVQPGEQCDERGQEHWNGRFATGGLRAAGRPPRHHLDGPGLDLAQAHASEPGPRRYPVDRSAGRVVGGEGFGRQRGALEQTGCPLIINIQIEPQAEVSPVVRVDSLLVSHETRIPGGKNPGNAKERDAVQAKAPAGTHLRGSRDGRIPGTRLRGIEWGHPLFPGARHWVALSALSHCDLLNTAPLPHDLQVAAVILIEKERLLPAISPLGDVMW